MRRGDPINWICPGPSGAVRHSAGMREKATLKLDNGAEVRVELDTDDLSHEELVVRRAPDNGGGDVPGTLITILDEHLATANRHPAGTTDQLLAVDRDRPY